MAYLSTDPLAGSSYSMNPGQAVDSGALIDHAPLGPTATTGTTPTPSGPPSGGNLQDPSYAAQLVAYWSTQPGANPSLKNDPNYWIKKITSGELGPDVNYIVSKFMKPEGAPVGAGGISNDPFGQYSQGYHLPTEQEAMNMPGLQFAIDQAGRAVQSSAAAKGTLLTGGTLKALSGYTTGTALQGYSNLANLGLGAYNTNYNVWRNNQNDTTNALYNMAQLGKPGS